MMIPSRATTSAAAVLLLVCLLGGAVEPAASSYIHSPIARGASSMAIEGATGITSLSKERYICIHATCPPSPASSLARSTNLLYPMTARGRC